MAGNLVHAYFPNIYLVRTLLYGDDGAHDHSVLVPAHAQVTHRRRRRTRSARPHDAPPGDGLGVMDGRFVWAFCLNRVPTAQGPVNVPSRPPKHNTVHLQQLPVRGISEAWHHVR